SRPWDGRPGEGGWGWDRSEVLFGGGAGLPPGWLQVEALQLALCTVLDGAQPRDPVGGTQEPGEEPPVHLGDGCPLQLRGGEPPQLPLDAGPGRAGGGGAAEKEKEPVVGRVGAGLGSDEPQLQPLEGQPRLLPDLPPDGLVGRLARFHLAARRGPQATEGLFAAAEHQVPPIPLHITEGAGALAGGILPEVLQRHLQAQPLPVPLQGGAPRLGIVHRTHPAVTAAHRAVPPPLAAGPPGGWPALPPPAGPGSTGPGHPPGPPRPPSAWPG